eukprot:CAMPEP_0184681556 /NCGR_PEP_ID=MMETSP0312-20130426/4540_1 /TAXON_ID=31354 /ORGANISM="Compsopogon coeruleus, Strain SAG 36.94" /LENGTH=572 /DNA_ID=CAMNT_0027132481 /DNA_START=90 /DNA_END=1808 /DNA_ORIENTATION=+
MSNPTITAGRLRVAGGGRSFWRIGLRREGRGEDLSELMDNTFLERDSFGPQRRPRSVETPRTMEFKGIIDSGPRSIRGETGSMEQLQRKRSFPGRAARNTIAQGMGSSHQTLDRGEGIADFHDRDELTGGELVNRTESAQDFGRIQLVDDEKTVSQVSLVARGYILEGLGNVRGSSAEYAQNFLSSKPDRLSSDLSQDAGIERASEWSMESEDFNIVSSSSTGHLLSMRETTSDLAPSNVRPTPTRPTRAPWSTRTSAGLRKFATLARRKRFSTEKFRVALVADVQFSHRKDRVLSGRLVGHRDTMRKIFNAIDEWNMMSRYNYLSLAVIIGNPADLSDNEDIFLEDLDLITKALNTSTIPVYYSLGTQCRTVNSRELSTRMMVPSDEIGFYEISPSPTWKILVLDGTECCPSAADATGNDVSELRQVCARWNTKFHWLGGAIRETQISWLKAQLELCAESDTYVCIICHQPIHPGAGDSESLLKNAPELMKVLEVHGTTVVAWIAGNDISGGYAMDLVGIHHVTLPGLFASPKEGTAWAVAEFQPRGRVQIIGKGQTPSRTISRGCLVKTE